MLLPCLPVVLFKNSTCVAPPFPGRAFREHRSSPAASPSSFLLPALPCRVVRLFAEAIPATPRVDDGERSLTGDRQEILVSRDQQISLPIDRRGQHPPVVRISDRER